jgi:GR25 family glycosyltransferase involved in LPS biosynthesis
MDKDKDRLDKITKSLSKQNIIFERIRGVPGKDVKDDKRLTEFCNSFCGDGIKGCALSHRNIWDLAYEKNYDAILVFEDDADISDDLSYQLQKIWDKRRADYDIITLGDYCYGRQKDNLCSLKQELFNTKPININDGFLKLKGFNCTHAMIISRRGIQKLRTHKINNHIDIEINNWFIEDNLKIYAVDTFEVKQNDDEGSNNANITSYPYYLNSLFKSIPMSNYRGADIDVNISQYKLGPINITYYIMLVFFITLLVPINYKFILLGYLIFEFIVTPSIANSKDFFIAWIAAFAISAFIRLRFYRNFKKVLY